MVDYESGENIHKENNIMLLRRCQYHLLQLAEEMATTTHRQLTEHERNNVLSYEMYLSDC